MNLFYRLDEKENENYNFTYNVSEASISTGLWIGENFYSEIIESNDMNRQRRVVAYSDSVSQSDLNELSSGKIILSKIVTIENVFDTHSADLILKLNKNIKNNMYFINFINIS